MCFYTPQTQIQRKTKTTLTTYPWEILVLKMYQMSKILITLFYLYLTAPLRWMELDSLNISFHWSKLIGFSESKILSDTCHGTVMILWVLLLIDRERLSSLPFLWHYIYITITLDISNCGSFQIFFDNFAKEGRSNTSPTVGVIVFYKLQHYLVEEWMIWWEGEGIIGDIQSLATIFLDSYVLIVTEVIDDNIVCVNVETSKLIDKKNSQGIRIVYYVVLLSKIFELISFEKWFYVINKC